MPAFRTTEVMPGEIYLRDADFKGQDLRLAYTYLAEPRCPNPSGC
jgi:two-component system sensor histidine kinase TctE